ncbi:MAG: hypothetical protein U0V02_05605 [Anaerolineales bacterium]
MVYICLGIDGGINYSLRVATFGFAKFANERNLKLHVVDIEKEYGQSATDIGRGQSPRIWQTLRRAALPNAMK